MLYFVAFRVTEVKYTVSEIRIEYGHRARSLGLAVLKIG